MSAQETPDRDSTISVISGLFGGFLGIAVALSLAPVIVPSGQFLSLSNYLQILAAFSGAVVFSYYSLRHGGGPGLPGRPGHLLSGELPTSPGMLRSFSGSVPLRSRA